MRMRSPGKSSISAAHVLRAVKRNAKPAHPKTRLSNFIEGLQEFSDVRRKWRASRFFETAAENQVKTAFAVDETRRPCKKCVMKLPGFAAFGCIAFFSFASFAEVNKVETV